MSSLQSLPAAASNAERSHGILDGRHNDRNRHDHAIHHDVLDALGIERVLSGETQETHCSVAQILGQHTIDKHVRHDGRFDKHDTHCDVASASEVRGDCSPAEGQAGAFRAAVSTHYDTLLSLSCAYTLRIVNGCNESVSGSRPAFISNRSIASAGKRFSQITGEGAGYGVGQHQSVDDAVFLSVGNPGDQPDFAIYPLDIDARGEHVRDYHGFGERWVAFVSHSSFSSGIAQGRGEGSSLTVPVSNPAPATTSHSSISLPLEVAPPSQRDRLGAPPPPAPSHQFTMVSA